MNEICLYCKYRGRDGVCRYFTAYAGNTFEAWRLGFDLQRDNARENGGNCWRFEPSPSLKRKRLTMEALRRLPLGVIAKLYGRGKK